VVASSSHKKSFENSHEGIHEIGQRAIGGANLRDPKLSASTAGTHLYKIKQKLQLANQSEMSLLAMRHGLIDSNMA